MMNATVSEVEGFVSEEQEGNPLEADRVPAEYLRRLSDKYPVYGVKARWHTNTLTACKLRRVGTIANFKGVTQESGSTEVDIDTRGVDVLEIVFQTGFLNGKGLRQWYV